MAARTTRARADDDGGDDRSSARINGRSERSEDRRAVGSAPSSSSSSPFSFFLFLLPLLFLPLAPLLLPLLAGCRARRGRWSSGPAGELGAGRVAVPGELGARGADELGAAAGDHMWRCLAFRHLPSQLASNFLNFLPRPPHAITRHLDKFRDFWTSFGFYII